MLARLLAKGDTPDLIFYRRRTAISPPPTILTASSPEFANLLPAFPAIWSPQLKSAVNADWPVPPALRGKLVRIEIEAASTQVEPFAARLRFQRDRKVVAEFLLKPYLHAEGGKEFFVLPIPADAEKCVVQLRLTRKSGAVNFTGFRAVVEPGGK